MTNPHDRIDEGRRLLAVERNERQGGHTIASDAAWMKLAAHLIKDAEFFLHTLPSELEAAHARIAALEALCLQAGTYYAKGGVYPILGLMSERLKEAGQGATLLSSASGGEEDGPHLADILDRAESIPTPAPAKDVVERVARAIYEADYPGDPYSVKWEECEDQEATRIAARAALSALPLNRERIRQIRERHAGFSETGWLFIGNDGEQAHNDRAFLLQQLGNLGDENGD